jgi:predicted RND superfamily exporter protein
MRAVANWVSAHPRGVLVLVGLLCALAIAALVDPATGELRLRIDPALNQLLPDDDPSRRLYDGLVERFGSDDVLVLALEVEDVFRTSVLRRLERITRALEALDGVDRVLSLASASRLRSVDGDLEIAPLLAEIPDSRRELQALRRTVLGDPIHGGNLVSRNGRVAALFVHLDQIPESEMIERGLDLQVLRTAEQHANGARVWMAGTPFVKAEMSRILVSDLAVMLPAVVVLMLAVCGAAFRTRIASVVPVATVLVALLWTLGAMAWMGHALNIVTSLVPVLVLVVGFAYVVHVVAAHREAVRKSRVAGAREAVRSSLERVGFAVVLTALTTAAGFLSLAAQPLHVIREFGLWSALGVGAALAASLTLAPALLALAPASTPQPGSDWERAVDRAAARLGAFDLRHRRAIVALGAVLLAAAGAAMTRIEVNTEVIDNFAGGSRVRLGYEVINASLEGANQLYVMVQAPAAGAFKDPTALRELEALQNWLEGQPEVGGTTSAVDHLAAIHQAFAGGDESERRIPDSRRLAAQLLLIGGSGELDKFIDGRYRTATILVRSTATESREMAALVRRIESRLDALEKGLTGSVTGNGVLLARTTDDISQGQALSLVWAFAMIFGILAFYFRSLRLGIVALLPNVLPVAVYFGALGATGVTLNNATALMGCMILGIAVDDTVHFLVHFRQAARRGGGEASAAVVALREVARPVSYTTLVLCLGLLVVTTSDLETQAQFGALGAFTLAFAWAVDLVLTPALCSLMRIPVAPVSARSELTPLESGAG